MDIDKRNKNLCEMYVSGYTIPQISRDSGLSMSQLSRIFRASGVKRKKYELDLEYFETNKNKTIREMSEETGLTHKRVRHLWNIAYGKKITKGRTDFTDESPTVDQSLIDDPEWLYDQYVNESNGAPTIAKMLAMKCSDVYKALKRHGIKRRTVKNMMSKKRKWPSREWLEKYYTDKRWSIQRCAEELGIGWQSVYASLRRHGIRMRSASEQHVGDLNEFYGKRHDDEVKEKCRNIGSEHGSKYWSTGDVDGKIAATRSRCIELWADPQRRSDASKRTSEMCKLGKCNPKSIVYERKNGNMLPLKSSWEALVAKILDRCEVVAEWDYEAVSLEYMDEDVVRNFIVDFWVRWTDGLETLIECKNQRLLKKDRGQLKIKALNEYCDKHGCGCVLIDTKEQIKKMTAGYKSLVEWRNDTRYYVHRKYLEEPPLFIEIMFHEITYKICPWKPLQYSGDELTNDIIRLKKENLDAYWRNGSMHSTASNSGGMPGRLIMSHFNTHFWDVPPKKQKQLPLVFEDRRSIYRCLKISYSENESLSTERLLREINFHCHGYGRTSHFAPGFARTIIRLLDMHGCRIFDPCCGWGGRLLGSWLEGCSYSGCDISPLTYGGLINISNFIGYDCDIRNESCVNMDWPDHDLVLTSPPFYNVEQYVGGDQPWKIYRSRNGWIDKFIRPFIDRVYGKCALYLDHKTKDDYESVRKFDEIIEIKNRRHARHKNLGTELLCIYTP